MVIQIKNFCCKIILGKQGTPKEIPRNRKYSYATDRVASAVCARREEEVVG